MKRKLLAALAALAVVLELLPWSAVITVTGEEKTARLYYSCFNPTPFVAHHFGPLFTAVASSFLLLFTLIYLSGKALKMVQVLSGAAFVFSLFSLFSGDKRCFLGIVLAVLFLGETVLSFLDLPEKKKKRKIVHAGKRRRRK